MWCAFVRRKGLLTYIFLTFCFVFSTIGFFDVHVCPADVVDAFDYPVGSYGPYGLCPENIGSSSCYWLCQDFLKDVDINCNRISSATHLGEDWNRGLGYTDFGDLVYAVADGEIVYAQTATGWGNVVIVRHTLPDGSQVESLYGHLKDVYYTFGNVTRGQPIGTIGDGNGVTTSHLHFEIRYPNCRAWGRPGPGYSLDPTGWTDPSEFIENHQRATIADQSVYPNTAFPGDVLTMVYKINNPTQDPISNIRLGARIRTSDPQGPWIDDPAHDEVVTLTPGEHDYSRTFRILDTASEGLYDVGWVILYHDTGEWIDNKESIKILTISSEAIVPSPTITSSLNVLHSPPYYTGDTITAEFTITNKGEAPIEFDVLTVGGRINDICPDDLCPDFEWHRSITLTPNQSYNYQGDLTLSQAGSYHFFCAYRLPDGSWNTSVPTENGVANTLDIVVNNRPPNLNPPEVNNDVNDPPEVGTPVTLSVSAEGSGDLYYQFWIGKEYGESWQIIQPWSTNNSCTYIPPEEGNYILLAWISDSPSGEDYHQAGFSFATSGHSESGIVISDISSDLTFPQPERTPITLRATATGGNPLYYKFWFTADNGASWNVIRDWSESNTATWIPQNAGVYTVVVWVSQDPNDQITHPAISGFTCRIGEVITNSSPFQPTALTQFKSDGVRGIPAGSTIDEDVIILTGGVSDPDNDMVRLEIELRRLDQYGGNFTGVPTHKTYFTSTGSRASLVVSDLTNGSYHWRARTGDLKGGVSTWLTAGGNPDSVADFIVQTQNQPPTISSLSADPATVYPEGTSTVSVSASDPEGDPLSYTWSTTGGSLSASIGPGPVIWSSPSSPGIYTITVTVTDNEPGHNPVSQSVNITVSAGNPPGPISLNVYPECSGNNPAIRLSWFTQTSAEGTTYEIYKRSTLLVSGLSYTTDSYVDTGVVAGVSYTYFVRARNAAGTSDSPSMSCTAPTNCVFTLSAQPECSGNVSQIRLTWSVPSSGANSYKVYRNGSEIFSTFSATQYTDTSVIAGASYTYFVRAFISSGVQDSASSSVSALNCGTSPPGIFTLSATSECSGTAPQIRLTWTSSSGVDIYRVYRNGIQISDDIPYTTYLDTAVTSGTSYTYYVAAINGGGQTNSNQLTLTAQCTTPPGVFTLTVTPWCDGSAPENVLEWTGSAGRTLPYEIYRNGSLIFTQELGIYHDAEVTAGANYSYFVRAKNSVGSRDSNTITVTTKTDCGAPVAPVINSISPPAVTVGSGGFTLTISGSNFDSTCWVLWGISSPDEYLITSPTFVNSSTLTVNVTQDSQGFNPFRYPGIIQMQVIKPYPEYPQGPRSNTRSFAIYNPIPSISSISGSCQAQYNCTPSNGYDVRINGSGFISGTNVKINGNQTPAFCLGQGPVYSQMQLFVNGSLIPTPGTYTIEVCNEGTTQGRACSTGSLTVTP